ncbi:MAG: anthranilate phosphoribosyltransferase [Abitibacteriaceae bacterium]|nr:anthranilate phosphoribosyltransferase [Abditibacteriaceae bacterium]
MEHNGSHVRNLQAALKAITSGQSLSEVEAEAAMGDIMDGIAPPLQVAAALGALRVRGETVPEITGFARAMRARAVRVSSHHPILVDTCGTGGDDPKSGCSTFNISTAASLIAAGAGAIIAKHGNRAMSSRCGSADVLEALGVNLDLDAEQIGHCIDEVGLGFMFAQKHHPAMKHVGPIRKELGIRTVFNLLGPLTNPAGATAQVMGVPDKKWLRPIGEVLLALGTQHAIVAHSEDGLDEFSTCAPTYYVEVHQGSLREDILHPEQLGCACALPEALQGGDAQQNATVIQQLLHDGQGPTADIACLNAAAVLIAADMAQGFPEGLKLARASVNAGAAREKLAHLIKFTNSITTMENHRDTEAQRF